MLTPAAQAGGQAGGLAGSPGSCLGAWQEERGNVGRTGDRQTSLSRRRILGSGLFGLKGGC